MFTDIKNMKWSNNLNKDVNIHISKKLNFKQIIDKACLNHVKKTKKRVSFYFHCSFSISSHPFSRGSNPEGQSLPIKSYFEKKRRNSLFHFLSMIRLFNISIATLLLSINIKANIEAKLSYLLRRILFFYFYI